MCVFCHLLSLRTGDSDDLLFLDIGVFPVWKLRILDRDDLICFHLCARRVWKLVSLEKCVCVCVLRYPSVTLTRFFCIDLCVQSFVYTSPMITCWIWFTELCLQSLFVHSCFCRVLFTECRLQSFVYEVYFREHRLHKYVYRIVLSELCLQTFFDRASLIDFCSQSFVYIAVVTELCWQSFLAELCLQS